LFKDAPKPAPSASRPGRGPFDLGVGAPFLFYFQSCDLERLFVSLKDHLKDNLKDILEVIVCSSDVTNQAILVQVFDAVTSPRCYALIAWK
jgi:hypothetical protein